METTTALPMSSPLTAIMSSPRPTLSISLPESEFAYTENQMPRTPEQVEQCLTTEPPPPPRPQTFKVRRRRLVTPLTEPDNLSDSAIVPSIEMSEVPAEISSPIFQSTPAAHLLSPVPTSFHRSLTPPKTPAPRVNLVLSQLDSPAEEWDLISNARPALCRSGSICSSFSDSSISSCGMSDFSLPTGGCDSPTCETTDPFLEEDGPRSAKFSQDSTSPPQGSLPEAKRVKTRRDIKWTSAMDDHLWMTFMAYLSDPTLTPFKMLPGSHPPMGVCDQVASKARRTWRSRKPNSALAESINVLLASGMSQFENSDDTIRPSMLQSLPARWPKVAATRRRLRELCARRPSISAHYQRMLRTRSPSPFETSSPPSRFSEPPSTTYSSHDLRVSLVTSTAPSMQPEGPLAQLGSDESSARPVPQRFTSDDNLPRPRSQRNTRPDRPSDWFARIPRSKAHQKSASLQSTLQVGTANSHAAPSLASPFTSSADESHRTHLLQSMAGTKSLGRTEFNGKSLDSPLRFGVTTAPRSRKRRFRSDEEKPRRPALEDVFGPPAETEFVRNRGFSVGAVRATDNLTKLFTPISSSADMEMSEAPSSASLFDSMPMGSRTAPRRLAEPIPRLGSPFVEMPLSGRQHNTFPRASLPQTPGNQPLFHQRLRSFGADQSAPFSNGYSFEHP